MIFSKPTIICARFPRNPVSIPMTCLSISIHFDLVTIPRFCCLCQCMSLIPLTFLNVSIFWKLFSLGCLHRCQWKNPNFCCQPTQKNLLRYPHLGQAQTKVAKVAKVAVCTSAHQTVLRKLAPSNQSFRPSLDSTVGGWFKNPAPPDFEAAIVKPWRNAHG